MDVPVNSFYVRIDENNRMTVKFTNKNEAIEYADRYKAMVVKEHGKDIWYVIPKNTGNQITWDEAD
jgi:hypothetical protein